MSWAAKLSRGALRFGLDGLRLRQLGEYESQDCKHHLQRENPQTKGALLPSASRGQIHTRFTAFAISFTTGARPGFDAA